MNQEIKKPEQRYTISDYLDRIFFVLTLLYFSAVFYWINLPRPVQSTSPTPQKTSLNAVSNTQFLSYLKESLKIAQKTAIIQKQTPPTPLTTIPPVVRVPFSPTPLKPKPSPPVIKLPLTATKPLQPVVKVPIPPKPPEIVTIPLPPKPQVTLPILVPGARPEPLADIILIGVLEDQTNAAALFSIKGVTKRVQAGDPVGSSGWVFQGVTQQKALISKQGKTRYIEVGQKF